MADDQSLPLLFLNPRMSSTSRVHLCVCVFTRTPGFFVPHQVYSTFLRMEEHFWNCRRLVVFPRLKGRKNVTLILFFLYYFLALIIVTSLLRDLGELHNSRIRSKTHIWYDSSITLNRLDVIEKCDYSWSCGFRRKITTRWRRANL